MLGLDMLDSSVAWYSMALNLIPLSVLRFFRGAAKPPPPDEYIDKKDKKS